MDRILADRQTDRQTDRQADRQRELWVDVCRGIGILLVVLGHCRPGYLTKVIYGFHMPLFFILSGYLFHYDNLSFQDLIRKLGREYIIPYFFLCAINYVLQLLICLVTGNKFTALKYLAGIFYSRGLVEWLPNCSPLWYLTAQFVALIIFYLICRVQNKVVRYLILPMCLALVSYLLYMFEVPKLLWNIDTACMAIILISFGCWMKREYQGRISPIRLFIIAAIVGFAGMNFNPIEAVSFDDNQYGNFILMLLGAIGLSIVVIIISKLIAMKNERVFSKIGKHTIFIMAFDYFAEGIAAYRISNPYGMFVVKCGILFIGFLIWNGIARMLPECGLKHLMVKC